MKKEKIFEIIIVVVSMLLAFLFAISRPGKLINLKLFDIFYSMKPRPAEWNKIRFVEINDDSLDLEGRWPWSRAKIAKGIEVMKELGVDKILFDIEFIDLSKKALNYEMLPTILSNYTQYPLSAVEDSLFVDPDKVLLKSMLSDGKTNVYLAGRVTEDSKKQWTDVATDPYKELAYFADRIFITNWDRNLTNYLPSYKYMEIPVFPLYLGVRGIGSTVTGKDIDGTLRRIPLFYIYHDYLVPTLALPVLMDTLKIDKDHIKIVPGKFVKMKMENGSVITIPIDEQGRMILSWSKKWGKSPFGRHVGFHELLQYRKLEDTVAYQEKMSTQYDLDAEDLAVLAENKQTLAKSRKILSELKGKIVIVGLSAQAATDIGATTLEAKTPLMTTHANVLNTIFQGDFLAKAPPLTDALIVLILVLIMLVAGLWVKSALNELLLAIGLFVLLGLTDYLMLASGFVVNYTFTFMAAIFSFIALIANKFVLYDQQKNQIKSTFMQYLSPDVVKELVDNPDLARLGGKRQEITAYFSDVQGFTGISEGLAPEELVHLLNEYLTSMTDIILSHGGTVDKYEGDAIVAFFGAPIPHEDHARRACRASIDMQKKLDKLREHWVGEGYPPILARMGVNTGQAVVGNMGSQQRMDYTMMGDTVNLASRLEGANKAYGSYLMISQATKEAIGDEFVTRKLDLLKVVGKKEPIIVYELMERKLHADEKMLQLVEAYNEAIALYEQRQWAEAFKRFEAIEKTYNDPPSHTYAERCAKFKRKAPPADWNGVYILKSK